MQCFWSPTTKATSWRAFRYGRCAAINLSGLRMNEMLGRTPRRSFTRCSPFANASALATRSYESHHKYTSNPPPEPSTHTSIGRAASSLTAAQISRAAAQAVRLTAREGRLDNSLYVINSLHFSRHGSQLPRPTGSNVTPLDPIDFGPHVSPRLSAHSFLHALVRQKQTSVAAKYAEFMMAQGIRLHKTTTETIVRSLCKDPSLSSAGIPLLLKRPLASFSGSTITLRPEHFRHSGHQAAYSILATAKEFGQHRSKRMYESLISACIMQGEIIVGSLLFVLLVKDWQAHTTTQQAAANSSEVDQVDIIATSSSLPYPSMRLMQLIASNIAHKLRQTPPDQGDVTTLQELLQALANIVQLVECGSFPNGRITALVYALTHVPRTSTPVWIRRGDEDISVKAYTYFHDFLLRLIEALKSKDSPLNVRPDLRTCNTLLSYSLRHRLSPGYATTILEYMHARGMSPDGVTYNILGRAGTLLRRADISNIAWRALFRGEISSHPGTIDIPLDDTVAAHTLSQKQFSRNRSGRKVQKRLQKIREEGFKLIHSAPSSIQADGHALTSYITYLTATGKPHMVSDILFRILPELHIIDHPSWGDLPLKERRNLRRASREACLRRAVKHGPYFFAAILNALSKAGQTGLAERVWLLAEEAQRASWIEGFAPGIKPWCLSIHAYTAMLNCYANETKKGVPGKLSEYDEEWIPQSNDRVRGWAHFIMRTHPSRIFTRHRTGREMGMEVFNAMMSGGSEVVHTLLLRARQDNDAALPLPPPTVQMPQPDARFFNAALRLLSHYPGMQPLPSKRLSRCRWKSRGRFLYEKHELTGRVLDGWHPMLQEIAEAMVKAGYSVPPVYRPRFLGRWQPGTTQCGPPRDIAARRTPYAFSRLSRRKFCASSIPTSRSRGLPVRRYRRRETVA